MSASLVGSEMCIRDRAISPSDSRKRAAGGRRKLLEAIRHCTQWLALLSTCLLYTSDAADDM
eukprot:4375310-Alexandrium_andersonii.AAC.1